MGFSEEMRRSLGVTRLVNRSISPSPISHLIIPFRTISYHQRRRRSGAGKNWTNWYNEFKEHAPHYSNDPSHIRWYPEELKSESRLLEAKAYQRLFDSFPEEMNFTRACALVDRLRLHHGIQPESWAYAGVLIHIGELKDIPFMTHFWKQLKSTNLPNLGANTFNAMAYSFARNRDIEGAQYVLEELQAAGFSLSTNSYNALCSFDQPSLQFMEAIMETLHDKNLKPNVDTYTMMMQCYTRELDFEKVMENFNAITENGGKPTLASYNSLLHSRCVAEQPNDARELLEYMNTEKPHGCAPSTTSYNHLLQYFDSHGKPEEAEQLLKVMKERKVPFDTETINCVVRSKYNYGDPHAAVKFFESMSFRRNEASFAAVIDACVQAGLYDKAISYFNQAKKRGFSYNERSSKPTYIEPLPSVYPRRCDYWESVGDHMMTWDKAIQFNI